MLRDFNLVSIRKLVEFDCDEFAPSRRKSNGSAADKQKGAHDRRFSASQLPRSRRDIYGRLWRMRADPSTKLKRGSERKTKREKSSHVKRSRKSARDRVVQTAHAASHCLKKREASSKQ